MSIMKKRCAAGAKDCGNFLAAESHSSFPLSSSLSHEGALAGHYFSIKSTKREVLKCDFSTACSPGFFFFFFFFLFFLLFFSFLSFFFSFLFFF